MWNSTSKQMLWQVDTEWSNRLPVGEQRRNIPEEHEKIITFYNFAKDHALSKYDYAWLTERGYVKTTGDYNGHFKASWQIVVLSNKEVTDQLFAISERIREAHKEEFEALKAPYVKAVLDAVPAHLRKQKEYELQYTFHSDGWFLLHCIHALLQNGKLKEPTEGQRKALSTVLLPR